MIMSVSELSISAAALITVIVVIRALAINRLPKRTFTVLWAVVLLRLLVPFSTPSGLSIYNLFTPPAAAVQNIQPALQAAATPSGAANTAVALHAGAAGALVSPALLVWLAGAAIAGVVIAAGYIKCCREFKTSLPARKPEITEWLAKNALRRKVQVRISDRITGPLTYGIFRPVILLPKTADWNNRQWLDYVLEHELVHIRHFDTLFKMVLAATACLHWFNPMVWVMYLLANRDIELSCDESVIRKFGESSITHYAMTLIRLQEKRNGMPLIRTSFGRYAIIERINAIMKTKRITIISIVVAILIVAGTTTVFATSAVKQPPAVEVAHTSNAADASVYSQYEEYGLTIKDGKLYFEGERVRRFNDQYPGGNFSTKAVGYYEKSGTVDVSAVRDSQNALTGLKALPQSEFDKNTPVEGEQAAKADSLQNTGDVNIYKDYEPYGLAYDEENKTLTYEGKRVRYFSDKFIPENSIYVYSEISNWDENGVIDVLAVHGEENKGFDETAAGALTGLRVATPGEYADNSLLWDNKDTSQIEKSANAD